MKALVASDVCRTFYRMTLSACYRLEKVKRVNPSWEFRFAIVVSIEDLQKS